MAKLSVKGVTYSATIVAAVLYVLCALAIWVAPQGTIAFFAYLFHGINLSALPGQALTLGNAVIGLIITVVGTAVISAAFTALYNKLEA